MFGGNLVFTPQPYTSLRLHHEFFVRGLLREFGNISRE